MTTLINTGVSNTVLTKTWRATVRRITPAFIALSLLFSADSAASIPIPLDLMAEPHTQASRAWPVLPPLSAPDSLRACCAFGYNLHVKLYGLPLPLYRINNIIQPGETGHHHYNNSQLQTLLNLAGLGAERNGIVYTEHGGFIDTAHVRDSADMTLYIFSHLWRQIGQPFTLQLTDELTQRHIIFSAYSPPADPAQRYTLAAWLSASLAYQLAGWHEIAQWYGYQSVTGFPEGISAFSPEDLYSNLLGTRIAVNLILDGHAASPGMYNATMDTLINEALDQLVALPATGTRAQFDQRDQHWWNSQCAIPDKFLLIKRNYHTSDNRLPSGAQHFLSAAWRLALPHSLYGYQFDQLAQLRLPPGKHMQRLPAPHDAYTVADFPKLANDAQQQDQHWLHQHEPHQHGQKQPPHACN